jgi:hypothetical protein
VRVPAKHVGDFALIIVNNGTRPATPLIPALKGSLPRVATYVDRLARRIVRSGPSEMLVSVLRPSEIGVLVSPRGNS